MSKDTDCGILGTLDIDSPIPDRDQLLPILKNVFSHVLRRTDIGEDDDFFEFGGDSILAIALMAKIEENTGYSLPVTVLYDAPTAKTLSIFIKQGQVLASSHLLTLKPGLPDTPLYIIHGIGGTVMELRDLANSINTSKRIYGIEALGVDGCASPIEQIEEMASLYCQEVTKVQPEGPYYLMGYSFGGLVALEMARCFSKMGQKIAFLGLIDTFPHVRSWPLSCRVGGLALAISNMPWLQIFQHYSMVFRDLPLRKRIVFPFKVASRAVQRPFNNVKLGFWLLGLKQAGKIPQLGTTDSTLAPIYLQRLLQAHRRAFDSYRPSYFAGEIIFIEAKETNFFDARRLWSRVASSLIIKTLPGTHHSLIKEDRQPLAEFLAAAINGASRVCEASSSSPAP